MHAYIQAVYLFIIIQAIYFYPAYTCTCTFTLHVCKCELLNASKIRPLCYVCIYVCLRVCT